MNRAVFRSVLVAVLCQIGVLLFSAESSFARTIRYVKPAPAGSGNGSSWANASGDLGAMLDASSAGDEVWVAAGTYDPGVNATATFSLRGGVALRGGFVGTETTPGTRPIPYPPTYLVGGTTSEPGSNHHIVTASFSADGQVSEFEGFYVGNGYADDSLFQDSRGAGLRLYDLHIDTVLLIESCTFYNCRAVTGGALSIESAGSVELRGCRLEGNRSIVDGGGAYLLVVLATVDGCCFSDNVCAGALSQSRGGALCAENFESLFISDSDFLNNTAGPTTIDYGGFAGAIHAATDSAVSTYRITMQDTTISNCRAVGPPTGQCGGAWLEASKITVDRCNISNCMSDGNDGGIRMYGVFITVANSIIAGNTASTNAGMRLTRAPYVGDYSIHNCIFWGNIAGLGSPFSSAGGFHHDNPLVMGDALKRISNCVFWSNTVAGSQNEAAQLRFGNLGNVTLEHSDVQGLSTPAFSAPAQMNIAVNPRFKDPAAGDFRLTVNSMALIDDGTNNADTDASMSGIQPITGASLDLLGLPRIRPPGGVVDMGAIEFECHVDLTCTGDANCDGMVGLADISVLLAHWDLPTFPGTNGDLDSSGRVGIEDLAIVIQHWTETCPA